MRSTRLDAFVDAAFAFALTLLVISGDHVPESIAHLVTALKSVPAFLLSFLLILKFWVGHVEWSRSYALDDPATRRLSLLLVFLVLVFVYPMRMVFEVLCNGLSGGYLPTTFTGTAADVPSLFIAFGVAFGSLGAVMLALHWHAWRQRDALGLTQVERIALRVKLATWWLVPIASAVSILLALLIPARAESGWWLGLPGFIYFTLNVATPLIERRGARRVAALPVHAARGPA